MALVIGLTGGIASGKSTVSRMFEELGIPVIDADKIAREVVEEGKPAYKKIVEAFGPAILSDNLEIDRPKLGALIFNNEEKRQILNQIVHPAIRNEMLSQKEHYLQNGYKIIVLDIPLLFESNLAHLVDKKLLVFVDDRIQLERLMARNNFDQNEAQARINSQMPLAQKVPLSDAVINNNGSLQETKEQLQNILADWNAL